MTSAQLVREIRQQTVQGNHVFTGKCCYDFFVTKDPQIEGDLIDTQKEDIAFWERVREADIIFQKGARAAGMPADSASMLAREWCAGAEVIIVNKKESVLERRLIVLDDWWAFRESSPMTNVCEYYLVRP